MQMQEEMHEESHDGEKQAHQSGPKADQDS